MSGAVAYSEAHFPTVNSQRSHVEFDNHFAVAACCMQGYRETMEDAHCIHFSLPIHKNTAFFGVFDGHAGKQASIWTAKHLPLYIDSLDEFTQDSINSACVRADEDFKQTSQGAGTTCVFAIVEPLQQPSNNTWKILIGNIGDSRSILIRSGKYVETLTQDHKPDDPKEARRIKRAGGFVVRHRVNGKLAMSRSLGDVNFKDDSLPPDQQIVIPVPDITHTFASPGDFLVLFCDGLVERNVFTNEEIAYFILQRLKERPDEMQAAISDLCHEALKRGSGDNMSIVIIQFKAQPSDFASQSVEGLQMPQNTFFKN